MTPTGSTGGECLKSFHDLPSFEAMTPLENTHSARPKLTGAYRSQEPAAMPQAERSRIAPIVERLMHYAKGRALLRNLLPILPSFGYLDNENRAALGELLQLACTGHLGAVEDAIHEAAAKS